MSDFWEKAFNEKQEMWGFEPAISTVLANDIFVNHSVKSVLVLGIGYGRNAQLFLKNGMTVTGIEISPTAIDLAHKHLGDTVRIHHGSVTDMPFDDRQYDAIYCYAVIHFLDEQERAKLINDCYQQLGENGVMIFVTISKEAPIYGQGIPISKDRFEIFGGLKMYFYDSATITAAFAHAGLLSIKEVEDVYPFYLVTCKKEGAITL